jgi:hypothetical protein
LDTWINLFQQPGTFDTGLKPIANDHGSATHAGFDEVLEKNDLKLDTVPISATDHQSAILACSGGEIWKERFPVLDGVSPLTIHKKPGRPTGSGRDGLTGKDALKGVLNKPHPVLQSADIHVEMDETEDTSQLPTNLRFIIEKSQRYKHPGIADVLYDPTFRHVEKGRNCTACEKSSEKKIVERKEGRDGPKVHRGL